MKKKKKKGSYFKLNGLLLFIAALVTALMLATSGYISEGYTLEVNDVSNSKIKAPRQIENKVATENKKEAAAATVTPRFKVDAEVNEKVNESIEDFFTEMDILRRKHNEIFIPQRGEDKEENSLIDKETNRKEEEIKDASTQIKMYINDSQIEYILNLNQDEYNGLKENIYTFVNEILETGIKEEALPKVMVDLKNEFVDIYGNTDISQIGYDIASSFLMPNLVIDEEATETQKQVKRDEIEPIFYRKGQTIVDEGQIVTEEIYQALEDLGLISKGYKENIAPIAGVVLFVIAMFAIADTYIYFYNEKLYTNRNEALLLFVIYMIILFLTRLLHTNLPFVFMPILAFTMLIALLLDTRLAVVLNLLITFITTLLINGDIEVIFYFVIAGTILALISRFANQRNNIFIIGLALSFISSVTYFMVMLMIEKTVESTLLAHTFYAFFNGFLTVIICMGSLPLWEAVFGVVTPIKLLDLTNPSNELLRRLTIEAPGTYHHSLIVANLAETAAYDIGADPNIARVGGYYHDIGKLKYPQYFSENQIGENIHDYMDAYSSVQIITSHVNIGLQLADTAKLPNIIKEIIEQHHGNTIVKYFYHKAKEENKDSDKEIDINDFRYKHRIPQTKEAAIVMLADTVEAAVRSMVGQSKSMEEVEKFVRNLIKDKLDDGQLLDSGFTMKDIHTVGDSFMRVFKGMYHERIPYPKEEEEEKELDDESTIIEMEKEAK